MESFFPPFKDANYWASACQRAYFIRDANHVRSLLAYVLDARSYNNTAAAQLRMENSTGTVKSRFLNVEGKIRMKRKSLSGDTCKKKLQERRNQHFDEGHYFTSSYQGNLPARHGEDAAKNANIKRPEQNRSSKNKTHEAQQNHEKSHKENGSCEGIRLPLRPQPRLPEKLILALVPDQIFLTCIALILAGNE